VSTPADIAIPEQVNVQGVSSSFEEPSFANQPAGNLGIALLTWVASVLLLLLPNFLAIPYLVLHYQGQQPTAEVLLADKNFILINIAGVLPAHIITLIVVWLVATRCGERSIVEGLKLKWDGKFSLAASIGLAFLLYVAALLLTFKFGGQGTALDKLVESSRAAALTIAFLAVATAPIVEESVYRGILYPAVERASNAKVAVIIVTLLFAIPHVPQYWPNFAVIGSITLLSVALTILRAYTGRLLPCIVVHFIFNGIQSVIIVVDPYLRPALENMRNARGTGVLIQLLSHLH
jgi:membrane protease YdiL (CAAX protease family)